MLKVELSRVHTHTRIALKKIMLFSPAPSVLLRAVKDFSKLVPLRHQQYGHNRRKPIRFFMSSSISNVGNVVAVVRFLVKFGATFSCFSISLAASLTLGW